MHLNIWSHSVIFYDNEEALQVLRYNGKADFINPLYKSVQYITLMSLYLLSAGRCIMNLIMMIKVEQTPINKKLKRN